MTYIIASTIIITLRILAVTGIVIGTYFAGQGGI